MSDKWRIIDCTEKPSIPKNINDLYLLCYIFPHALFHIFSFPVLLESSPFWWIRLLSRASRHPASVTMTSKWMHLPHVSQSSLNPPKASFWFGRMKKHHQVSNAKHEIWCCGIRECWLHCHALDIIYDLGAGRQVMMTYSRQLEQ